LAGRSLRNANGRGSAPAPSHRVLKPLHSPADQQTDGAGVITVVSPTKWGRALAGAEPWHRRVALRCTATIPVVFVGSAAVSAPCATWPVQSANRYGGPWNATTPNPVLVVGTRFDPRTPYRGARAVSRLLGNAVLLTHEGYGHTTSVDPSACVVSTMGAYPTDLVTPPPGTVCASDRQPFDPDFGEPLP